MKQNFKSIINDLDSKVRQSNYQENDGFKRFLNSLKKKFYLNAKKALEDYTTFHFMKKLKKADKENIKNGLKSYVTNQYLKDFIKIEINNYAEFKEFIEKNNSNEKSILERNYFRDISLLADYLYEDCYANKRKPIVEKKVLPIEEKINSKKFNKELSVIEDKLVKMHLKFNIILKKGNVKAFMTYLSLGEEYIEKMGSHILVSKYNLMEKKISKEDKTYMRQLFGLINQTRLIELK